MLVASYYTWNVEHKIKLISQKLYETPILTDLHNTTGCLLGCHVNLISIQQPPKWRPGFLPTLNNATVVQLMYVPPADDHRATQHTS